MKLLFYLDKTIKPKLEEMEQSNSKELVHYDAFFQALGYSATRGNCYLCGERSTMKYLSGNSRFGGFYKVVNQKYPENNAVFREISEFFALTLDSKAFNPVKNLPDSLRKKEYHVIPVDECINQGWRLDIECFLLGENVRDCYFYTLIGERYLLDRKMKGVRLRFLNDHGGGGDIGRLFLERVQKDRIPTLCITDSDWKYGAFQGNKPEYGTTASTVREAFGKLLGMKLLPLFDAFIIDVHEAENLIPLQVLEDMISPSCQDMRKGVNVLQRLATLPQQPNPLLYYDFKEGISFGSKEGTKSAYWNDILQQLGEKNDNFFVPVQRTQLLEKVVERIRDKQSAKYLREITIDSHLQTVWQNIGMEVLTWGCAFSPQRV